MALFRIRCAWLAPILVTLNCALPAWGQEFRSKELTAQVEILILQGKYSEAEPLAIEVLKAAETAFGPDDPRVDSALGDLAQLYDKQEKYAEAESILLRRSEIDETAFGSDDARVAADCSKLAELYDKETRYAEAETLYRRAVQIDEKAFGPESSRVADDLSNLARHYSDQYKYSEAQPLFKRAFEIMEKAVESDEPRVADALDNLAGVYFNQRKYTEAAPLYERVLKIREKVLGPDHPDVAAALRNLAEAYGDQGRYTEAGPLLKRALKIWEKTPGTDDSDVGDAIGDLAKVYFNQRRYTEAEPLFEQVLKIREKTAGLDDSDFADALEGLAADFVNQHKYTEAESSYERIVKIREKALGLNHPDVADALRNLATIFVDEERPLDAERLYQRALQIDENTLGQNHPTVAIDLRCLAMLYHHVGRNAESEPLFQRALRIDEIADPNGLPVASDLNSFAVFYENQGNFSKAESLYNRALPIFELQSGSDSSDVALVLTDLAEIYSHQGKFTDAERLDQRALQIEEKSTGSDGSDLALVLNNLAGVYDDQNQYSKAEPLYRRAVQINEKLNPDSSNFAADLNNLAELYNKEGKYTEAEPLFQRALKVGEKALGPNHPYNRDVLDNFALLYDAQGKYAEAEPLEQRSLNIIFGWFDNNFTYMAEEERLALLNAVEEEFPAYFSFVHRYREQDPSLTGTMYNVLLWEKGFIAASIAAMRRQIESSGDQQSLDLLNQLSAKRSQIASLLNASSADAGQQQKQIELLRADAGSIETSLVTRSSAFAQHQKLQQATWQQIRDTLQPGEAAVEFVRFDYHDKNWLTRTETYYYYVVLVVTHDTRDHPAYIFLGESKQIEGEALTRFKQSTLARGFGPAQQDKLPGANAYDLLWKPLVPALAGATRIYLSMDGVLNTVPLGIISGPDGKLLMERYDLRLVLSTKDILRSSSQSTSNTAILVGDPDFALTEAQQRAALEKLALPQPQVSSQKAALSPDILRDAAGTAELHNLPDTGLEVRTIAQLMRDNGWQAGVYTQERALKQVVEQASSPRVVHLATHGFFLPNKKDKVDNVIAGGSESSGLEDPMLRSGLYFAGADRALAGKPSSEGFDNGVLTAMEAENLNLTGTELVVLSACDTGLGEVRNGEGVFGLRRGLQEAGAQAVLMSLWSVPDKETRDLMQLFYSKWLSGMEMHEALKEAQLEMREKVMREHNGHDLPYFWGAFVLVGR